MRVQAVGRPFVATAFELAGLGVERAEDSRAAAEAVARLASGENVGIVLVEEALYLELPRDLLARLDRQAPPVVVPLPGPSWDERRDAEAYVLEILRQAIGYRVRAR
jgi:vacuolar-type H+-ATPase subunit F/Vma7